MRLSSITSTTTACDDFRRLQLTRRDTLRAGVLSLTGLGLPQVLRARESGNSTGPNGFGRAKSCILIFMWGGPSQLDTWDPKPNAPEGVRGPFRPIATSVPGISIGEHFPLLAQQAHRLSIVRSMNHTDPAHLSTAHRLLTGHLAPTPNSDAAGPSPRDWPHLGALVSKLRPTAGAVPSAVNMPWSVMHPAAPGGRAPGQDAGWLGKAYDPFHVDGDPNDPGYHVEGLGLPDGISPARLAFRRSLLQKLAERANLSGQGPQSWDGYQQKALDGLVSAEARGAFAIDREGPKLRDRYGRNIHGQCLLLARRLIEAGVGLVTVNWHNDGQNFWDTHGDNFNQLKNRLMPPADQGFSTRRSSSGWVNSGAHRGSSAGAAGNTGRIVTRPSWPARASVAATYSVPPIDGRPTQPAIRSVLTTWAPPSCMRLASIRARSSRMRSIAP
jgi:hypothetical protein